MKTSVVAVVGNKRSGKTITIEILTRELTRRGYKVGVVKHIAEPDFTIDAEGKDTWRFAQSGAKTTISVAPAEIAIIEKIDTTCLSLEEILHRCRDVDLVFLEGLKKLVGGNSDVPKIVAVKSADEGLEASRTFRPILAFTGLYSIKTLNLNIPYINVLKDKKKVADIVEKNVKE